MDRVGELIRCDSYRALEDIVYLLKYYDGITYQVWLHNSQYRYKLQGEKKVLRVGDLQSLRFIEVPTHSIINKSVIITRGWLGAFCNAAQEGKRFYRGFMFRN